MDWGEVIKILLDGMPVSRFIAYYLAMAGGAVVYFALDVSHSTRSNGSTPRKFNFWFMVQDNVVRGLAVMIFMAASVIFYKDLYGVDLNIKLAFTSGLGIDALIGTVLKNGKDRGPLKKQRQRLMQRYSRQTPGTG